MACHALLATRQSEVKLMSRDEQQPTPEDTPEIIKQFQHDPYFRSTFSEPEMFRKLLVWLLPMLAELLDLDRLELEKDSLLDEQLKAYYTDLLYKIPIRGTNENIVVFVLVEHKTSSERWTMFQILRYIVLVWQREYNIAKEQGLLADFMLPLILPVIIYHGERKYTATTRFGELIRPVEGFVKYSPDFEGILYDLTLTTENDLPEDLELYAVLSVMQAVFRKRKDAVDRIMRIYHKLRPKLHEKKYLDRWMNLLRYMINSSKYFTYQDLIEVKNQMSDTDIFTISPCGEELMAIGYAKGEAIGLEKGIEKGLEKGIETLLLILIKNFGEVPPAISEKLRSIHDLDELGQLTCCALNCTTMDEFIETLRSFR